MTTKDNTKALIENLAQKAVTPVSSFPLHKALAALMVGSFIYLALLLSLAYGIRSDFLEKIQEGSYALELIVVLALIALSYVLIIFYATPQKYFKNYQKIALNLLFIAVSTLALTFAGDSYIHSEMPLTHMHCFGDVLIFALPTTIIGFIILKKNASTHPAWLGFTVMLLAGSIGYLGVRMSCAMDTVNHQAISHILPVVIYAVIGYFIGRKILSW